MREQPRIKSSMKTTPTTEDGNRNKQTEKKKKKGNLGGEKNFKTVSSCYQKKEKGEGGYIASVKQKQHAMKKKHSENVEESSKTLKIQQEK